MHFAWVILGALLLIACGGISLHATVQLRARVKAVGGMPLTVLANATAGSTRVRGQLQISTPLVSPFSKVPCCWYRMEIANLHSDENGDDWALIHEEQSEAEFLISDPESVLRVCPFGLKVSAPYTFEEKVRVGNENNDFQERLLDYARQHVRDSFYAPTHISLAKSVIQGKTQNYRFRELCLVPGETCDIAGTVTTDGGVRVLCQGGNETPFMLLTTPTDVRLSAEMDRVRKWIIGSVVSLILGLLLLCYSYFGDSTPGVDNSHTLAWYRKAAEGGSPEAQDHLGLLYEAGNGVPRDDTLAAFWYRKAAEQGNAQAQNDLAGLYAYGIGMPRDPRQAELWFRKAAEQGLAEAQDNMGVLYLNGRGVPKDAVQASQWFQKAAAQGNPDAKINLQIMRDSGSMVVLPYSRTQ